ncbi:MFS transporter [Pseudovibrio exalbescens]|uniref:MFS transporter n=1 Tax=Pseudovibrio exalbescens TaxID=197461 RepID=UPI000C9AA88A|nr:MFS transporter [Pseudovibrio exalbescens]
MVSLARFTLFLIVFVEAMGHGLVLPVLSDFFAGEPVASALADVGVSPAGVLALVIGGYYLLWFFSSAYLAQLSDSLGRRKVLSACLSGALLGYVVTALGVYFASLTLVVLGRLIAGATGGALPVVQASFADQSTSTADLTGKLGAFTAALALGLMAGPILSSVLVSPVVMGAWAQPVAPLLIAGLVTTAALVLVSLAMEETNRARHTTPFQVSAVFLSLWRVQRRPTVIKLGMAFFLFALGMNAFYIYLESFQRLRFGFSVAQISLTFVILGLATAVAATGLVRLMTPFYQRIPMVQIACGVMALFVLAYAANTLPPLSFMFMVPVSVAFGVIYPVILTLLSKSVREQEQGWVMGVAMSLFVLGGGVVALCGPVLMSLDIKSLLFVGVVSLIGSLVVQLTWWREPDVRALDPDVRPDL